MKLPTSNICSVLCLRLLVVYVSARRAVPSKVVRSTDRQLQGIRVTYIGGNAAALTHRIGGHVGAEQGEGVPAEHVWRRQQHGRSGRATAARRAVFCAPCPRPLKASYPSSRRLPCVALPSCSGPRRTTALGFGGFVCGPKSAEQKQDGGLSGPGAHHLAFEQRGGAACSALRCSGFRVSRGGFRGRSAGSLCWPCGSRPNLLGAGAPLPRFSSSSAGWATPGALNPKRVAGTNEVGLRRADTWQLLESVSGRTH